ncbi:hypothetical protein GTP41_02240 [Pseudoduganella sp. DS3]|uniref:Uncharacterized protein n=1 Tax=Pseudoduganella guangdongensis TaxID=2692179 RepID=A0A6N9HBS5_9BURK|nr:hypothetical protein [Pseudoduganella guangdongensis]MYN00910.1 hypothetical protein [Pseudoduganella guangdongensis]
MDNYISLPRALCAYLAAVTIAALVFVLPRFTPATLVLAWILAFVAALLPYAAGIAYANWRGIRSWRYFVGGGAATTLLYAPLLAAIHRPAHFFGLLPWLVLSGLAAGTVARWLVIQSPHNENPDPVNQLPAGGRHGRGPLAPVARIAPQ